jgi:hypothetical protein
VHGSYSYNLCALMKVFKVGKLHRAICSKNSHCTVVFLFRFCGYISRGEESSPYLCHVFQCTPNAASFTKALEEACRVIDISENLHIEENEES